MTAKRPNLLFFLSDNHNRDLAGCYGHPVIRTPTLDRIAGNGVRFADAYSVSPLCCPARAALATGRYPHQTGYWDNALAYDGRTASWMHRLRDAGYTVVSVGKLHFRSEKDDNGFSEEIVPMHILDGRGSLQTLLRAYGREPACTNGKRWDLYFKRSGVGETHYQEYDREITARAVDWLEKNGRGSKPWALFVSYISPHPPFAVPKHLYDLYPLDRVPLPPRFSPTERSNHPAAQHHRAQYGTLEITDERALRHVAASYLALITHVDLEMGKVLAKADRLGVTEDALTLYSSDHGELFGAHGLLGKGIMYEGAIGVPLLIAGLGIPKGRVVTGPVSHIDLFPTLLELCRVQAAREDANLPGRSLVPALSGASGGRRIFGEYHANYSKAASFFLREGSMKYVYHVGMPPELFDLAHDAHESCDLARDAGNLDLLAQWEDKLRGICDPEAVDARAKADQRALAERWGGPEAIEKSESIIFTPPPGVSGVEAGSVDAPAVGARTH